VLLGAGPKLCHWCRLPMLPADAADTELRATADHLKPLWRDGRTNWRNLVAAQASCNQDRARRDKLQGL
jgi:hypothetical protein